MTPSVLAQAPSAAPATRVLKRDRLRVRAEQDDQLLRLRHDIDEEIAATVDARVAAAEVALQAGQQAAHTAALQAAARSVDAAVAALPQQVTAAVDRLADEVVETAAVLAAWLCGPTGAAADAWTGGLAERIVDALGQLTAHESATVRLNPNDAAVLAETGHPVLGNVELRPDASLLPGEAMVSTGSGDVDLTLRTALRRAVEIVTGRAAAALTDHRDLQ